MLKSFQFFIQDLPEDIVTLLQKKRQEIDETNDYIAFSQALKDFTLKFIKDDSEFQGIKDSLSENELTNILRTTLRIIKFTSGIKNYLEITRSSNDPVINLFQAEGRFHPGELEKKWRFIKKQWNRLLKLKKQGVSFSFADEMDFLLSFITLAGNRHEFDKLFKYEKMVYDYFEIQSQKNTLTEFYKGLFYATLSFWVRETGKIKKAEQHNKKAEEFAEEIRHPFLDGWIANNRGAISISQGNFSKALEYFEDALNFWTSVGNLEGMGFALNNIGVIKNSMGLYKEAREAHLHSKDLHLRSAGQIYRTISFSNIADTFRAESKFEQALQTIEEGLSLEQQNKKPTLDLLYLLVEKIEILVGMKKTNNAKETLNHFKKCIKELNANHFKSQYYYLKGIIESIELNFGLAENALFKAIELSSESANNLRLLIKAQMQLARILITQYQHTENQTDIARAFSVVENLIVASEEQNFLPFLCDLLIIRSMLYLLTNQYEKSIEDLKKVLENKKIQELPSQYNRAKEQLSKIMKEDQSYSHKRATSELLAFLQESHSSIFSWDIYQPSNENTSELYGVFVSTEGGIPFYSKIFKDEMIDNDVLISGLISAISSFTREVVKKRKIGSLKSISHEEITILIERVNRELFVSFFVENDTHKIRLGLMQLAREIKQKILEKGINFDANFSEKNSKVTKIIEKAVSKVLPSV
ncbi:MAG: hypothetical protein GF308_16800 [Candidatus Heimdallarchaeota archaeon]|nr:hypothetical protein [Candidatus Heimdallarchaeota archaeon]